MTNQRLRNEGNHPRRWNLASAFMNRAYMEQRKLHVEVMTRSFAWLETGTTSLSCRRANTSNSLSSARDYRLPALRRLHAGSIGADLMSVCDHQIGGPHLGCFGLRGASPPCMCVIGAALAYRFVAREDIWIVQIVCQY
jgi:hypothetical protein